MKVHTLQASSEHIAVNRHIGASLVSRKEGFCGEIVKRQYGVIWAAFHFDHSANLLGFPQEAPRLTISQRSLVCFYDQ